MKTKYQHQAIINPALIAAGLTEETLIRQQIHQLVEGIPLEDLIKVFTVVTECKHINYLSGDQQRITTSIEI